MIRSRDYWVKTNRWIAGFLTLFTLALASLVQGVDQVTYYHNDALGSPVAATDASGAVIWRESYLPHGKRRTYEARETSCQAGTCTPVETQGDEKLWYTGKFEETSVGLLYLGARWYDPDLGRFLSVDPASYTPESYESFNRYAYANNNPYKFTDPNGRSAVTAIGGLIYETSQFVQGNGFDGQSVLGALADGYNGEGDGFAAAAFVDATSLIPGGVAISAIRGLRVASQAARVAKSGPLWSSTKNKSAVENALGHWNKHKSEFPDLQNAKQYAERSKSFLTNPPEGTLTKINSRGDTLRYDPGTNTFGVLSKEGAPRTMFRPQDGMDYWNRQ